ncbi:MAG: bifunctional folylpolyglutamate synthase/dihydrofolate synthase [Gammaproteobacteria bacterium]|nr:bifunctional folylpolyglutamate synthase/dihydrofolate synthase [Gammaproteobacteria bacterium]
MRGRKTPRRVHDRRRMTGRARRPQRLGEWLAHIQTQHWRSIDLQLDRIARVWQRLRGRPAGLVISVAGTNGKGSSVAMLDAVLRAAGLSTGAYTSPHLARYNERVKINGRAVEDAELCEAFAAIEAARDGVPLTYFEFGTLCALLIFARRRVDASLLEVGMGGRLDAVNLVDNDLALITCIGIDHAQWLGDTRDAIGAEKAGIMKRGKAAVCADPSPPPCIAQLAAERGCALAQAGLDYQITRRDGGVEWRSAISTVAAAGPEWRCLRLETPLPGACQADNLGGVVAALALTRARSGVSVAHLNRGLANTDLAARCQVIAAAADAPETVLDVAHNPDAAAALAAFLAARPARKTRAVFAALKDKPVADLIAPMAAAVAHWHLATISGERGRPAAALAAEVTHALAAAGNPATVSTHASPTAAYRAAMAAAARDADAARQRVVVFGSFQLVGAILARIDASASRDRARHRES